MLDEENTVQPGFVYVSRERLAIIREQSVRGGPDLVVEILSPSSVAHDRVRKMALYARFRIPHYWIVDPEHHILEAFRLEENHYIVEAGAGEDDLFRPSLFPELKIPLKLLWHNE
ncbi:MAG: Uma2 family endonuclease [Armatimonadetes bacterium]|nr:Uma2 family endonuclease [Armatimonadota bacterium]